MPSHRDYGWIHNHPLLDNYCIWFVENSSVDEVAAALPTTGRRETVDLEGLFERAGDCWDEHSGDRLLVGLRPEGRWTMGFEFNGFVGVTASLATPLSRGRHVISNYLGGHGIGRFEWFVDGAVATSFEPLFAADRRGTDPDAPLRAMELVGGFDLDPDEYAQREEFHDREAVFALVEALTGVVITPANLDGYTFTAVEVIMPPLFER